MEILNQQFRFSTGAAFGNRLVKAAMTEGLAERGAPGAALVRLYRRWAASGAGASPFRPMQPWLKLRAGAAGGGEAKTCPVKEADDDH